jgi:hypothetical protein
VQHVAAADRVARHHRHHRLGQPPDLDVQVGDVEAPDARAARDVARVPAHALVAAGAERVRPLAGQHDHADLGSSRATSIAREISTIVSGRNALRPPGGRW